VVFSGYFGVLEDITGKALSAADVFTLSIKALVDHLLSMLKKQGNIIHNDDVQWILNKKMHRPY
jgi:hypothetical protein